MNRDNFSLFNFKRKIIFQNINRNSRCVDGQLKLSIEILWDTVFETENFQRFTQHATMQFRILLIYILQFIK